MNIRTTDIKIDQIFEDLKTKHCTETTNPKALYEILVTYEEIIIENKKLKNKLFVKNMQTKMYNKK